MKNKNFIVIQGWMINELKLQGNELLLYAIIYGFTQDGINEYYGSYSYISKAMGISTNSVKANLEKLLKKKLIKRVSESHYIAIQESCRGEKELYKNLVEPLQETCSPAIQETCSNKDNNNNKNNNNSNSEELQSPLLENPVKEGLFMSDSGVAQEYKDNNKNNNKEKDDNIIKNKNIAQVIKWFEDKEVNAGASRWYQNKTQREASRVLVEKFSMKQIEGAVEALRFTNARPRYEFPLVKTPQSLLDNWHVIESLIGKKLEEQSKPKMI